MRKNIYKSVNGGIHYWTNNFERGRATLVMLPGLTADHRLFDKQVAAFENEYNLLVWDAPGHAASRPFELDFSLADKADWLHQILEFEGIKKPILIGQSMGGYLAQCYIQQYPGQVAGFISIDSAPLKRCYVSAWEIWLLKRITPVYRLYPWSLLLKSGPKGCATTVYGRQLMHDMMYDYEKDYYCRLAGHGYRILAEAMAADLPYKISCPCLLMCGEHDMAGSARRYNRAWAQKEGHKLVWVPCAGHNANTDNPEFVNDQIREFLAGIN